MPRPSPSYSGHSLIELLVVVAVLGALLTGGGITLGRGLSSVEARGAAQAWQAAGAWAQASALWRAETMDLSLAHGALALSSQAGSAESPDTATDTVFAESGDLGACLPDVAADTNVARWTQADGIVLRFAGGTAFPNSAGSIFFRSLTGAYRVTVRLESGLMLRTKAPGS